MNKLAQNKIFDSNSTFHPNKDISNTNSLHSFNKEF